MQRHFKCDAIKTGEIFYFILYYTKFFHILKERLLYFFIFKKPGRSNIQFQWLSDITS